MYENGRRLNRYARKMLQRSNRKKRNTPIGFQSYESFREYYMKRKGLAQCGDRQLPVCWWKKESRNRFSWKSADWKRNLKTDAHARERAYYREQIAHYELLEDGVNCRRRKFSDPWIWV